MVGRWPLATLKDNLVKGTARLKAYSIYGNQGALITPVVYILVHTLERFSWGPINSSCEMKRFFQPVGASHLVEALKYLTEESGAGPQGIFVF